MSQPSQHELKQELVDAIRMLERAEYIDHNGHCSARRDPNSFYINSGASVRGTLTVVFAGAVAGLLGGALFWLLERRLPRAAWWRGLTFGGVCLAVAAPGIRPPQLLTFSLFAPFFLTYGLVVTWAWGRWRNARSGDP